MDSRINVTKPSMPDFSEYMEEIKSIWETKWLTNMGNKHKRLEDELVRYLDVDNVSLIVNGHLALEIGLNALKLDGEVITTPFTFASTTHAIVRNHLTPVFCDIDPSNFTIDVSKIERLITEKTCAILPVHVYGNICDVEEIKRIAQKYSLKVLYDAAHAFGEKYKGCGVMSYGDMSMLSFHATKVFHTIEGGAICYNNPELKETIEKVRDFGIKDEETVDHIGVNGKMNEFSAAMGLCNLRHIDTEIQKRKRIDEKYRDVLEKMPGIRLNPINSNVIQNYAYFPVLIDEKKCGYSRDDLCSYMASKNIYARKYFFPLTNDFACYRGRFDVRETPIADQVSKRVLALPLYADMSDNDVKRVCDVFLEWRYKTNV